MIEIIPLAQLKHSKLNVRRTGGKSVDELAASIRAIGLQQNLGVAQAGKGYEVVFGGRRLRALQALAKAGELPESLAEGIPCTVLSAEEAHEASLAENTVREAMHPLDQFRAFAEMAEAGKPVADIAAHFGVTERVVEGRMRLARVSPKLLEVYGEGGMTLEELQAFAVVEDHAHQERVWKTVKDGVYLRHPERIREALLRDGVTNEDVRVRLVGLEAYEAAGGATRRDLFSDVVVLLDEGLLDRLVEQRLVEVVEAVKAEGWSWVEVGERPRWDAPCIQPAKDRAEDDELTPDEIAAMEAADEAGDALALDAIEEAARTWPEGAKERAGAVVYLGYNGVVIYRGLLREGEQAPESEDSEDQAHEDDQGATPAAKPEKDPAAIPAGQVLQLTTLRTGELRLAMIEDPRKAVIALTAHLAEDWRAKYVANPSGITIAHRDGPEVPEHYQAAAALWEKRLAFNGPVLEWLAGQPWDTVIVLLAFLTAQSLDLVQRYPNQKGLGDELCDYFDLDMARRWRPDAEFLQRIPSAAILQALRESGMKEKELAPLAKLKKAELAGRAADFLRDKIWVPDCLRLPRAERAKKAKKGGKDAAAGE